MSGFVLVGLLSLNWQQAGPSGSGLFGYVRSPNPDTIIGVSGHVWVSTDAGASWEARIKFFGYDLDYGTMTMDRSLLAYVENKGLSRSTDLGTSWTDINTVQSDLQSVRMTDEFYDPIVLLAGVTSTGNGVIVYRSTDNGTTWTTASVLASAYDVCALGYTPAGGILGRAWMVYRDNGNLVMAESRDLGTSWIPRDILPDSLYSSAYDILTDPTDTSNVFYCGPINSFPPKGFIRATSDGGATWSFVDTTTLATSLLGLSNLLLAGSADPEGIKSYDPGGDTAWLYTDEGVIQLWSAYPGTSPIFAATEGRGIIRSTDNGTTWDYATGALIAGTGFLISNIAAAGDTVYWLDTQSGRLYMSSNEGAIWFRVDDINPVFDPKGDFPMAGFAVAMSDPDHIFVSVNNLSRSITFYRSTDGGATWTSGSALTVPLFTSLAARSDTELYGFGISFVSGQSGVYRSIDAGNSWTLVYTYPWGDSALAGVVAADSGYVYFTDSLGIVYSQNGTTWNRLTTPFSDVGSIDAAKGFLYATAVDSPGAWEYEESTSNWNYILSVSPGFTDTLILPDVDADGAGRQAVSWVILDNVDTVSFVASRQLPTDPWSVDSLPNLGISPLTMTRNYILASSAGDGVWRAYLPVGVDERAGKPGGQLSLRVHGETVEMSLPSPGHISLRLYDPAGRMVQELADEGVSGGVLRMELPEVRPGVYFLRLDAGAMGCAMTKVAVVR